MKSLKRITVLLLLLVTNLVYAQGVYVPYTIVNSFSGAHGTPADINDQDDATFYGGLSNATTLNVLIGASDVFYVNYISNNTIINDTTYLTNKLSIYDSGNNLIDSILPNQTKLLNNKLLANKNYWFIFKSYNDSNRVIINELRLFSSLLTQTEPLQVENFYKIQDGYIEPTNNSIVQLYNINGQLITELKEGNFKLETEKIYFLQVSAGEKRYYEKLILR